MLVVDSTIVVVQVVDVGPDYETLGVGPGAISNTVARVDSRLSAGRLRAQIGSPRPAAGAHRLGKLLTVRVRARRTTQIRAIAWSDTGDEEPYRFSLLLLGNGLNGCHQEHHP